MYIGAIEARRFPTQSVRFMRQAAGMNHGLDQRIAEAFDEVACKDDAMLVQLGAFDGHFDDPVRRYIERYSLRDGSGLRALLVEPQQDACERLRTHYKSKRFPGVSVACIALGAEVAEIPLFSKGEPRERFWSANATTVPGQLERVIRHHWLKALTSGTDEIRQEVVASMPLEHILKRHEVDPSDITMFVTDIEGSDALAMQQLFLKRAPTRS